MALKKWGAQRDGRWREDLAAQGFSPTSSLVLELLSESGYSLCFWRIPASGRWAAVHLCKVSVIIPTLPSIHVAERKVITKPTLDILFAEVKAALVQFKSVLKIVLITLQKESEEPREASSSDKIFNWSGQILHQSSPSLFSWCKFRSLTAITRRIMCLLSVTVASLSGSGPIINVVTQERQTLHINPSPGPTGAATPRNAAIYRDPAARQKPKTRLWSNVFSSCVWDLKEGMEV